MEKILNKVIAEKWKNEKMEYKKMKINIKTNKTNQKNNENHP